MENNKDIVKDFISTLSHEIRTPLTSIKGFSQTIYDNFDSLSDEQKKKFLLIINEQSKRLINLVENVLNVAKLEGGENNIILKDINLKKIINSTVDIVKMTYKTHKFEIDINDNTPHSMSDYDKLQQILLNILENACKYSPQNSTIKISAITNCEKNYIKIRDEGLGIDNDSIPKIFDKFYRVGDALKNKAQGSGLGLYISKALAEKINAQIEVESSTDVNNHFTEFSVITPVFNLEDITYKVLRN